MELIALAAHVRDSVEQTFDVVLDTRCALWARTVKPGSTRCSHDVDSHQTDPDHLLSDGQFHSGEQLGEQLGISRAAVSKHMAALRSWGWISLA